MTADAVGGVWPYALDLAAGLHECGIETMLAVLGPPPTSAQRRAAAREARLAIRTCRLEWMDDPWDDVEAAGEWLLELETSTCPDVVHLNGYCHAALAWRAPTLVVAHSCVGSWWRAVHGSSVPPAFDRYRREVARGLAHADTIVAPTAAMLAALEQEYGAPRPSRVIANGRTASAPPRGPREPLVFAAGRVWDDAKNIEALRAVASGLSWPTYVAGDTSGPAGRPAPSGGVTYLGCLEPDLMRDWFRRAAIYAHPARYEPFGLSVLEAAQGGCALVLGDIPSLRENWQGAAVFVPPEDRHALAAAIQQLIDDPAARARWARRAASRARQFTVARMAREYARVYADLVARKRTRMSWNTAASVL